jgi:hypothetical protein
MSEDEEPIAEVELEDVDPEDAEDLEAEFATQAGSIIFSIY